MKKIKQIPKNTVYDWLTQSQHINFPSVTKSSWLWSYGSCIYNYICNLSPQTLWVWIPLSQGEEDYNVQQPKVWRHDAPLGHIILIPSLRYSILCGEATNTNMIVFGLTWPGPESTIYHSWGEHNDHYIFDVVYWSLKCVTSLVICTCMYNLFV